MQRNSPVSSCRPFPILGSFKLQSTVKTSQELSCLRRKRLTPHLTRIAAWPGAAKAPLTHTLPVMQLPPSGAALRRRCRGAAARSHRGPSHSLPGVRTRPERTRRVCTGAAGQSARRGALQTRPAQRARVTRTPRGPRATDRERKWVVSQFRTDTHTNTHNTTHTPSWHRPSPCVTGLRANFPKLQRREILSLPASPGPSATGTEVSDWKRGAASRLCGCPGTPRCPLHPFASVQSAAIAQLAAKQLRPSSRRTTALSPCRTQPGFPVGKVKLTPHLVPGTRGGTRRGCDPVSAGLSPTWLSLAPALSATMPSGPASPSRERSRRRFPPLGQQQLEASQQPLLASVPHPRSSDHVPPLPSSSPMIHEVPYLEAPTSPLPFAVPPGALQQAPSAGPPGWRTVATVLWVERGSGTHRPEPRPPTPAVHPGHLFPPPQDGTRPPARRNPSVAETRPVPLSL